MRNVTNRQLYAVCGNNASDVFTMGRYNTILHYGPAQPTLGNRLFLAMLRKQ